MKNLSKTNNLNTLNIETNPVKYIALGLIIILSLIILSWIGEVDASSSYLTTTTSSSSSNSTADTDTTSVSGYLPAGTLVLDVITDADDRDRSCSGPGSIYFKEAKVDVTVSQGSTVIDSYSKELCRRQETRFITLQIPTGGTYKLTVTTTVEDNSLTATAVIGQPVSELCFSHQGVRYSSWSESVTWELKGNNDIYYGVTEAWIDNAPSTTACIDLGTVTSGQYELSIKSDDTLRTKKAIVSQFSGRTDLTGSVTLREGDINNDNRVNFNDQIILAPAFPSQVGSSNYNADADLNEDGYVNFNDLILMAANLGLTGD